MTAFSESRINDIVPQLLNTVGGPLWNTNIVVVQSGYEQRNKVWSQMRGQWQLGERNIDQTEKTALVNFFNARNGRFQGFRFKDWADYTADYTTGVLGTSGLGTGLSTYQLYKNYTDGADTYQNKVVKPVSGTVTVKQDGTLISPSIDYTTGIVTVSPNFVYSITAITQANPGLVTTSSFHGLSNGQVVYISGVVGMTQVNNLYFTVNVVNSTQFQLQGVNTTSYSAYVSGGNVSVYPQSTNHLIWSGQFDVPVRFDSDNLQYRLDQIIESQGVSTPWFYLMALPIVEIRI